MVTECTQTQRNPGFCVQEEWDLLTLLSVDAECDERDDDVQDEDQFDDIGRPQSNKKNTGFCSFIYIKKTEAGKISR